ncbi:MAG: hypothetical protein KAU31_02765, partial [Spirochaetaceae bacterium]|nr:hypothetical protein [Spirochaetaceae bacterium]
ATLVWDDVALAESYSVHNLRYGEVQNDVTSPFDWTGLTNGELYSFQIKATSSEGNDNWSEIQDVIPLSFLTLAPSVVPQYRKILVEWASIPAADEYVVSRSLDPSGPFTTRTITANTEFTDGNVLLDQEYYYRVRPFSQDFIDSDSNGAQPSPIPPERWYIVDTIVLPGSAFAVTIAGDRAYVAAYGSGLEIVDISDPISMSTAGSAVTSRYYQDIAVSGDRAFLVGYSVPYLDMFDLSDPTYPVTLTYWNSAWGKPYAIDVSGNYAYVAAGSGGGLRIFDVSGSGPFGTPIAAAGISSASDVDVSGDFAYVTDTCSGPACGLHIIDILNPTFPQIGLRPLPGMTAGVAVAGGLAYVANGGEGLQIVNATAPYAIEGAQATSGGATHVAVSGDFAYVGGDDGLTVVDISNPTFPIVGTRKIPRDETESYAVWGIAVAGSLVYVAAEEAGLVVIDTLDPTYPIVGSCDTPGWASAVAISGSYAFVADGDTGLQVVDISDPAFPVVGSTPTPGNAEAIVVHGDRVYIGESDFGVQVIDVSIPATPTVIGATAMPVSGRYAYV